MIFSLAVAAVCSCFGETSVAKQMKQQSQQIEKIMSKGYIKYNQKQFANIDKVILKTQQVFNRAIEEEADVKECCFIQQTSRLALLSVVNGKITLLNRIAPFSSLWVHFLDGFVPFGNNRLPGVSKEASISILHDSLNNEDAPAQVARYLSWLNTDSDRQYFFKLLLTTNYAASDVVVDSNLDALKNDPELTNLLELQLKYMLIYNTLNEAKFNKIKDFHTQPSWKLYNQIELITKAGNRPFVDDHSSIQPLYDYVFKSISINKHNDYDVSKAFVLATTFTNHNCKAFTATFANGEYELSNSVYIRSIYNALYYFQSLECADEITAAINAEQISLRYFKTLASELLRKVPQSEEWLQKTGAYYYTEIEGIKFAELGASEQGLLGLIKAKGFKRESRLVASQLYFYGAARKYAMKDEGYLEIVENYQAQLDGYLAELDVTLTIDEVVGNIIRLAKSLNGQYQSKAPQ